jgi:hypothetical protein
MSGCNKISLFNMALTSSYFGVFTFLTIFTALRFNNISSLDALPLILFAIIIDALMLAGIDYI